MIRLTIPSIEEEDLRAVREVIQSGYLVQGKQVTDFEKIVASYVGSKYAIAVSNCTAALHLSLLALSVQPGDLVLVTAYSYPATANVIELCGAQPVFIDILPDTFNMDPVLLTRTLDQLMANQGTAQKVKAILPVHAFGQMADMPSILGIAESYNIPVIEDAACALGASINEKQAGSWGIMGCFSFHPRKAITTGEGGIITTNDQSLARHLKALRNHGQDPDSLSINFILPGFNYRLTEFQAALGITQMAKIDRIITARRSLAVNYDSLLKKTGSIVPAVISGMKPVYQSYVILLPEKMIGDRNQLIKQLKDKGIETNIGTWHMPMTTYFRTKYNFQPGDFPVTDMIFARSLTLPLHEQLTEEDQKFVVDNLISQINF